jgi:hypothetical protein
MVMKCLILYEYISFLPTYTCLRKGCPVSTGLEQDGVEGNGSVDLERK